MAYEDQRTILPTGLLSTASKPKYTPKPITLSFPTSGKPDPEHKNPDKELQRQKRIQQQQLEASQGGSKVICTRYAALGYMSLEIFEADQAFGDLVEAFDPEYMAWYHSWAVPIVKHCMHCNTWASRAMVHLGWNLVKPWSEEMAYRMGRLDNGNHFGEFLMLCSGLLFKLTHWRGLCSKL